MSIGARGVPGWALFFILTHSKHFIAGFYSFISSICRLRATPLSNLQFSIDLAGFLEYIASKINLKRGIDHDVPHE